MPHFYEDVIISVLFYCLDLKFRSIGQINEADVLRAEQVKEED